LVKPPSGASKRKSPLGAHICGIFCSAAFRRQHCDSSAAAALGDGTRLRDIADRHVIAGAAMILAAMILATMSCHDIAALKR
jgi:hypothetical protein